MKRTGKRRAAVLAAALAASVALAGCGDKVYEGPKDSYESIDAVPGATFDIPRDTLDAATAVTALDESADYSAGTYVYKDGASDYVLFNIGAFVIAASNETGFSMRENGKDAVTEDGLLDGIWFSPDKKGLKEETEDSGGVYKAVMNVKADVSITPDAYGGFAGKFATIETDDGYECSIFAGVAGDDVKSIDKSKIKILDHVVKSLRYSPATAGLAAAEPEEEEAPEEAAPGIKPSEPEDEEEETVYGSISKSEPEEEGEEAPGESESQAEEAEEPDGEEEPGSQNSGKKSGSSKKTKKNKQAKKSKKSKKSGKSGEKASAKSGSKKGGKNKAEEEVVAVVEEDGGDVAAPEEAPSGSIKASGGKEESGGGQQGKEPAGGGNESKEGRGSGKSKESEETKESEEAEETEKAQKAKKAKEGKEAEKPEKANDGGADGEEAQPAAEPEEGAGEGDSGEEKPEELDKPEKQQKEKKKQVARGQSNQRRKAKNDGSSDLYHMLKVGEFGDYMTLTGSGELEECRMEIDRLYTGADADRVLKRLLEAEGGEFEPAAPGTSWHVVRYSLSDSPDVMYTNICLRGLDGGTRRYRGVGYSKRTRDILGEMKPGGEGYGNLYCYYAVPNGCTEYMLEAGERDGSGKSTACYLVDGFRDAPKRGGSDGRQ